MSFAPILTIRDFNQVRIITAALRAHGFHPLEESETGVPSLPGVTGLGGIAIRVPVAEAEDAKALAEALYRDMWG